MLQKFNKKRYSNKSESQSVEKLSNSMSDKYFLFFEYSPISLWIEDLSKVKAYLDSIVNESNTGIKTYLQNHPEILPQLTSLIAVKEVNKATLKLYNAKNKEYLINNLSYIFTENSTEGFIKLLVDLLLGKKETEVESTNRTFDGKEINVLVKFKVADDSLNSLENVIVSIEDITESVKTRKALAERENRYKKSQEIAKIGSWFYDFSTKKLVWTDEAFKLIEMEPQQNQLSLEFYLSFLHKDDLKLAADFSVKNLLNNPNQTLKYRIITKKGVLKYIYETRNVIIENNKIIRIIGIAQDITESTISEQKLNTSKNLLSNTLSSIKDGFVILDNKSNYVYVNKQAADYLGREANDLIGKNMWIEFPEKEGDLFFDQYYKALKKRKPVSFENYFEPWDRWFENRIIPSNDGMLLFFHEITSQKNSENKIKEAYNIINKSSSVAILCENKRDFPCVFASENAKKLFGYTHNEFLTGKIKIHELVYHEDLPKIRDIVFKMVNGENPKGIKPAPIRIKTKNGEIKWIEINFDLTFNKKGIVSHIQGIVEDITDRKKTEDLFFESSQRIKDQFNNTPLASIIWDLDFKVLEWNNSAERIFGYSAEEIVGTKIEDILTPPHLIEEMKLLRNTIFSKNRSLKNTNENITKSGKIIICDWYSVTLKDAQNNIIGTACLVDDITESIHSKKLLENSEKKYRDIFEKSIDPVMILKNGLFVDCNESTLKLFGYSNKKALLNIHPSQISPEKQPNGEDSFLKAEEALKVALIEGSNRFRWYHKQKNGHVFPAEVSLTKIEENDNQTTIHVVIKDITDRVKKEKIERVLYNISNAALAINNFDKFCFFIKNELHKIIDTNNFYIALYNEDFNTIETPFIVDQHNFEITNFPVEKTLIGNVIKSKKSLKVNSKELSILIEKGEVNMVSPISKMWIGVPLKTKNKVFGALAVQSYIDENAYNDNDVNLLEFVANQISSAIQIKNTQKELKTALLKAQESDKLKSAFLANMSHEIRTPMNGIIGFSELFLNTDLTDNERKKYATIVINSSKQLLSIVNDILDISKIEAGVVQLNYENISINEMLDNHNEFYGPIAIENSIILKCTKGLKDEDSFIKIDQTKLNQILTNLLSNAFKFTNKGSIEYGYELVENKLQFFVKDTGIGIDEKIQHKIFDRFIQANLESNAQIKGAGLGLAISKKFVELFNGEIWFNSNNEGTAVYFTIPYDKVKKEINTVFTEPEKPLTNVKNSEITILIAEDEEYNMLYMNELFSNSNYKIIEAENGSIALELAKKHYEIDLIFMDIKMPIMNGNEALIEIKKIRPELPIVALSAFAMESDKEKALAKGFDSYLTKPLDRKKLFELIQHFTTKQ